MSIAIWLQLAMVACYLPYGVVTALAPDSGQISSVYYSWRYPSVTVFLKKKKLVVTPYSLQRCALNFSVLNVSFATMVTVLGKGFTIFVNKNNFQVTTS